MYNKYGVVSSGSSTHTAEKAVAIIPLAFHSNIKETILSEIKEQSNNMSKFSVQNEFKHLQHYSVLENDDKYGRFRNWCEQQAEIYAKEIQGIIYQKQFKITDSWFNVSDTGGFQHQHYHANSYLSGVYYVNFDAEKGHCPTSFTKDERSFMQNSSTLQLLKTKYTEFNQNDVIYTKEGELILFPSYTTHGYKRIRETIE